MKNESCSNCNYFLQTSHRAEQIIGYCRANPPTPFYERNEGGEVVPKIARFPVVLGNLWCGMWEQEMGERETYE